MKSNALIVIESLVFKVTGSYMSEVREVTFDLNVGISCREATRVRLKPCISRILSTNSCRRLGHQIDVSFHNLCLVGKCWEDDSWSHLRTLNLRICPL